MALRNYFYDLFDKTKVSHVKVVHDKASLPQENLTTSCDNSLSSLSCLLKRSNSSEELESRWNSPKMASDSCLMPTRRATTTSSSSSFTKTKVGRTKSDSALSVPQRTLSPHDAARQTRRKISKLQDFSNKQEEQESVRKSKTFLQSFESRIKSSMNVFQEKSQSVPPPPQPLPSSSSSFSTPPNPRKSKKHTNNKTSDRKALDAECSADKALTIPRRLASPYHAERPAFLEEKQNTTRFGKQIVMKEQPKDDKFDEIYAIASTIYETTQPNKNKMNLVRQDALRCLPQLAHKTQNDTTTTSTSTTQTTTTITTTPTTTTIIGTGPVSPSWTANHRAAQAEKDPSSEYILPKSLLSLPLAATAATSC